MTSNAEKKLKINNFKFMSLLLSKYSFEIQQHSLSVQQVKSTQI